MTWSWRSEIPALAHFPARSIHGLKIILQRIIWHLPLPSWAIRQSSPWSAWLPIRSPSCQSIGFGRGNIRAKVPWETLKIPHHLAAVEGNPKTTHSWSHCLTSIHHTAFNWKPDSHVDTIYSYFGSCKYTVDKRSPAKYCYNVGAGNHEEHPLIHTHSLT